MRVYEYPNGDLLVPAAAYEPVTRGLYGDGVKRVTEGQAEWDKWQEWMIRTGFEPTQIEEDGKDWNPHDHPRGPDGQFIDLFATPARSEVDDTAPYFQTPRWKQFEAQVKDEAKSEDVPILSIEHTDGIWSETPEPSGTFRFDGPPEKVDAIGARVGKRWNQDAVLTFQADDNAADAKYVFRGAAFHNDTPTLLKALRDHGLYGATRNGEDIEVIVGPGVGDEENRDRMLELGIALDALGIDRYPGKAHLIESKDYDRYSDQGSNRRGAPEGDGAEDHRHAPSEDSPCGCGDAKGPGWDEHQHPRDPAGRFAHLTDAPEPGFGTSPLDAIDDLTPQDLHSTELGFRPQDSKLSEGQWTGMIDYVSPQAYTRMQNAYRDPKALKSFMQKVVDQNTEKFGLNAFDRWPGYSGLSKTQIRDKLVQEADARAQAFADGIHEHGVSMKGTRGWRYTTLHHLPEHLRKQLQDGKPIDVREPGFLSVGKSEDASTFIGQQTHHGDDGVLLHIKIESDTPAIDPTKNGEKKTAPEMIFPPGTPMHFTGVEQSSDQPNTGTSQQDELLQMLQGLRPPSAPIYEVTI